MMPYAAHSSCQACLQDSALTRDTLCYIEPTADVLEAHEASLRAIYKVYAKGDGAIGSALASTKLLDFV